MHYNRIQTTNVYEGNKTNVNRTANAISGQRPHIPKIGRTCTLKALTYSMCVCVGALIRAGNERKIEIGFHFAFISVRKPIYSQYHLAAIQRESKFCSFWFDLNDVFHLLSIQRSSDPSTLTQYILMQNAMMSTTSFNHKWTLINSLYCCDSSQFLFFNQFLKGRLSNLKS